MTAGTGDPAARDPGLQPERTRLAWRRNALANAVVALLVIRLALGHGVAGAVGAAAALAGWTLVVAVTYRRMAGPRRAGSPPRPGGSGRDRPDPVPGGPALPLSAAIAVGYALLGGALLLTR
ncbi:DUF202 domain-containing protein [Plantactinospora sp. GCM10030261]|uniref:DUF202 domain-containing protein n=1 Tax=Plantactinospora sp. GCM10030261 TaxID=3273420 RepID=UPI00362392D0